MRRMLLAFASLCALTLASRAQVVTPGPPNLPWVNVRDYGAACDGVTDDAAAFNAAVAAFRLKVNGGSGIAARLIGPGGNCVIKSTINMTNIRSYGAVIDMSGTVLFGATNGTPVIDALGTRFITWYSLTIWGQVASLTPSIGIQIGRTDIGSNNSSDNNVFYSPHLFGNFTFTPWYNFSSEITKVDKPSITNGQVGSNCFAMVQDSLNHWSVTSAFLTQNAPADTNQSFNENVIDNGSVTTTGAGCVPVWMSGTHRHAWRTTYIANFAGGVGVMLYASAAGGGQNTDSWFDAHMESNALTSNFQITGTQTGPILQGFYYRDHVNQAANSVFLIDSGVTTVSMPNAVLDVGGGFTQTPVMWSAPTKVSGEGEVYLQGANAAVFNGPATWSGFIHTDNYATMVAGWTKPVAGSWTIIGPGQTLTSAGAIQQFNSGVGNTVSGANASALGGTASSATGIDSVVLGGSFASDRGRTAQVVNAAGRFSVTGDAQQTTFTMYGSTSNTVAVRMATNGTSTAGPTNCGNLPDNSAFSMDHVVTIRDVTTGDFAVWSIVGAGIKRGSGVGTTAIAATVFPSWTKVSASSATASGWGSPTATADAVVGCMNITWTPPGANTDTFHVVDKVVTVEVQ